MRQSIGIPSVTPVIKWLLILLVGIWFFLQVILEGFAHVPVTNWFQLVPVQVLFEFKIWQLFTYMFLHAQDGVTHILFNCLTLWFFGSELENQFGKRFFLTFYIIGGVGAAFLYCLGIAAVSALTGSQADLLVPVVGASGAIYAVMTAYAWYFGDRVIHIYGVFPIKAKTMVIVLGFIQFASLLSASRRGGEVAYLAHISGIIVGLLYLWLKTRLGRIQWNAKLKKKSRNLRLVVDNDKSKGPPKYWN